MDTRTFTFELTLAGVDKTSPTSSGAEVGAAADDAIIIEMSEDMDQTATPATSAFTPAGIAASPSVSSLSWVDATRLRVNLSASVVESDTPTIAYTKPETDPLQDLAGNAADSWAAQIVTNNVSSSIVVMQDDFAGTTIDTAKWDITNPSDGVDIQQDNGLEFVSDLANPVLSTLTNYVETDDTVTEGCFQVELNQIDRLKANYNISLESDVNNRITITSSGANLKAVVWVGGVKVWDGGDSGVVASGKVVKLFYDTVNDICHFYYRVPSDSTWTELNSGTVLNYDIGGPVKGFIGVNSKSGTGTYTTILKNAYLSNANYSTANPDGGPSTPPPPTETVYDTLQGLIDAASGTLTLESKIYSESQTVTIPTGLSIDGNGAQILNNGSDKMLSMENGGGSQTISDITIDGQGCNRIIVVRDRDNITFDSITFKNAYIGGLLINHEYAGTSNNVTVTNCNFIDCSTEFTSFSYGAFMPEKITNGTFAHNTISGGTGYGIKGYSWAGVDCYDNDIQLIDVGPIQGTRRIAIEVWYLYDDCAVYSNTSNSWLSFVKGNKRNGTLAVDVYSNTLNLGTTTDKGSCAIEAITDDMKVRDNHIINARDGVAIWPGDSHYVDNIEIYGNTIEITRSWSITTKGVLIQPAYKNGSSDAHVTNVNIHNNNFNTHDEGVSIRCININDPLLYSQNITATYNTFTYSATAIYVHGILGGTVRVKCLVKNNNTYNSVTTNYKEENAIITAC